jgi:ankyrin repeat protein
MQKNTKPWFICMTKYKIHDCINKHDFPEYTDTIEAILRGEGQTGRLKGVLFKQPILKTRINQSDRLFWITEVHDKKVYMRVIEVVLNHDYQKAVCIRKRALDGDSAVIDFFKNQSDEALEKIETIEDKTRYFNHAFITLSEDQEAALTKLAPVVISGPAGSGKTVLLFEAMRTLLEDKDPSEEAPIVYVTQSEKLVHDLKMMWGEHDERVLFLTYDTLLTTFENLDMENKVQAHHLSEWQAGYLDLLQRSVLTKSITPDDRLLFTHLDKINQEFKVISAYEGHFSKQDYLTLGKKNTLFEGRQSLLFDAYLHYKTWLTDRGLFDPAFYQTTQSSIFHAVLVDESLLFSLQQLLNLSKLAIDFRVYYTMDSHQRYDELSYRPLFLNLLPKLLPWDMAVSHVELPKSYRYPNAITRLVNGVIELKRAQLSTQIDRYETKELPLWPEPEARPGFISLRNLNADDADLRCALESPRCVVLTHEKYKQEASERFGVKATIFSIDESQGLEFDVVIGFRLLDKSQDLNRLLTWLFVAMTRSTHAFHWVQERVHLLDHLMKPLKLIFSEFSLAVPKMHLMPVATKSQWLDEARGYLNNGNITQARGIFINRLGLSEVDFCAFHTEQESPSLVSPSSFSDVERNAHDFIPISPASVVKSRPFSPRQKKSPQSIVEGVKSPNLNDKTKPMHKTLNRQPLTDAQGFISMLFLSFNHKALDDLFAKKNAIEILSLIWTDKSTVLEVILKTDIYESIFYDFLLNNETMTNKTEMIRQIGSTIPCFIDYFALHFVSANGWERWITLFVAHGVDVNLLAQVDNATPLMSAVSLKHYNAVECLVRLGANLNCVTSRGWSPLLVAVQSKLNDFAWFFIFNGANLDQVNSKGDSALTFACQHNNKELITALIYAGANTEHVLDTYKYGDPMFELVFQAEQEKDSALRLLSDLKLEENKAFESLDYFFSDEEGCGHLLNDVFEYEGRRDILLAYLLGMPQYEQLLCNYIQKHKNGPMLFKELYYDFLDDHENSVVHVACDCGALSFLQLCVKARKNQHGFDENDAFDNDLVIDLDCLNVYRETPLFKACQRGWIEIVNLLVNAGANPSHCSDKKMTPLLVAIEHKRLDVALFLVEHGADVYPHHKEQYDALKLAKKWKKPELIRAIVMKRIANVRQQHEGSSPLISSGLFQVTPTIPHDTETCIIEPVSLL